MFLSRHQVLKGSVKIANKEVMSWILLVLAVKVVNTENPLENPVRLAHVSILA